MLLEENILYDSVCPSLTHPVTGVIILFWLIPNHLTVHRQFHKIHNICLGSWNIFYGYYLKNCLFYEQKGGLLPTISLFFCLFICLSVNRHVLFFISSLPVAITNSFGPLCCYVLFPSILELIGVYLERFLVIYGSSC